MIRNTILHRKKMMVVLMAVIILFTGLLLRLVLFWTMEGEYYADKATQLHERERAIKAKRGRIIDRNGIILADNKPVCTISVIHNQITDEGKVIELLSRELGMERETIAKKVQKRSSREKIKSNVEKAVGDRIRSYHLAGVKVDEDFKRTYPFQDMASRVLGFTGSDNQGILGLEVQYDHYLTGTPGLILTLTDAAGIEVTDGGERRIEPVSGMDLWITIDSTIQAYAQQLATQVLQAKQAQGVSIIVMNPQNGELLAMVHVPEYNLNDPFYIPQELYQEQGQLTEQRKQELLNKIWRNPIINDTYEPGSTFKVITAASALEEGIVTVDSSFFCPGYITVDDRRIRCHKVKGHGSEDFLHGTMNSCNPVFVTVGLKLGVSRFYSYFEKFGLKTKTGIDLPGEASTIMHKQDKMGNVELATVSFGQSFQITPMQLLTTVASLVNGGRRVTPHFAQRVTDENGLKEHYFVYPVKENIISSETSATLRQMLEMVVSEGGGKNGKLEGYSIGGKTATSETLPRHTGRYISSFLAFAPAEQPEVIAMCIIYIPQGMYYGGIIAAPVIRQLYDNILPYLGIEKTREDGV